jgi:hypothetical protein
MPTSKLSTSNEPDYKALLDELLAIIHRDGGQYTILTGYDVSLCDAKYIVEDTRKKLRHITERLIQLVNG